MPTLKEFAESGGFQAAQNSTLQRQVLETDLAQAELTVLAVTLPHMNKTAVPRFWLQPTASFMGGAPQREEYGDDKSFYKANLQYEEEWRAQYECGEAGCQNRDCPQHWPMKDQEAPAFDEDGERLGATVDELDGGNSIILPYSESITSKATRLARHLTRHQPAEQPSAISQKIELPIAANYVADWGLWEAVRELWQNALDQGQLTGVSPRLEHQDGILRITSAGKLKLSSLVLGNSTKASDTKLRGKFGEGYKLALLTLLRLKLIVSVSNADELWVPAFEHSERFDTEVLTIEVVPAKEGETQEVVFVIHGVTREDWQTLQLNMLDGVTYGILDDPCYKGRVYVGGLYVCTVKDFECGYSFRPDQLRLDRDRGLVSTYELQCLTGELWAARTTTQSLTRAVSYVKQGSNDTAYLASFAEADSPVVAAVVKDFENEHGAEAIPVSSQEEVVRAQAAGSKWVLVPRLLKDLMSKAKSFFIPSKKTPVERLKDLLENAKYRLTDADRKELEDIVRVMEGK